MGLGLALAAGIHREAIAWLCRGVALLPPGSTVDLRDLSARVVADSARAAALSIRLAFPVMAAVTSGHIALGVLTRTAPQLNVANVGFTIAIIAGGGSLYLVAPSAAEIAAEVARSAFAIR
jgi:flagellar biosynthesis protein FliR